MQNGAKLLELGRHNLIWTKVRQVEPTGSVFCAMAMAESLLQSSFSLHVDDMSSMGRGRPNEDLFRIEEVSKYDSLYIRHRTDLFPKVLQLVMFCWHPFQKERKTNIFGSLSPTVLTQAHVKLRTHTFCGGKYSLLV